jgi:hypothetical protein
MFPADRLADSVDQSPAAHPPLPNCKTRDKSEEPFAVEPFGKSWRLGFQISGLLSPRLKFEISDLKFQIANKAA